MGCGSSMPWLSPVNATAKDGTTLAEIVVPHMRDAHLVTGMMPEDFVPIVIVPVGAAQTCLGVPCCWTAIPAGFSAIVSRWGADVQGNEPDGTWSPGFKWFCCWHRVNRLVSKQLIIFDTPVKEVKTADHITVNIDVLIVCEIVKADDFIYQLGPEKLDSLLRATQEEVLRSVAYEIPVENIYDLHGHNTEAWVKEMNKMFEKYGVQIHHFTVRNVQIPTDMAQDFESKTLYQSKTIEKKMKQEEQKMDLSNQEEKSKLKEECDNLRMAAEEEMVTTRAQITKETREVLANTEKDMGMKEAEREAEIADMTATAELEAAKIAAEILAIQRQNKAKIEAEVEKLEAEATAYENSQKAKSRKEAQSKIAAGKKAVSEAEGEAAEAFSARRRQEQEMARLDILERLANNDQIIITSSLENNMGLAPDNSLVTQIAQQGMEAFRMRLAEMTASSVGKLDMKHTLAGGLVRPVPQQMK